MILEGILSLIKALLLSILGILPDLELIQLPSGFMQWFSSIVSASGYFLPLTDFFIMFGIWMMVTNFQIIWKTITRIWDALPFT